MVDNGGIRGGVLLTPDSFEFDAVVDGYQVAAEVGLHSFWVEEYRDEGGANTPVQPYDAWTLLGALASDTAGAPRLGCLAASCSPTECLPRVLKAMTISCVQRREITLGFGSGWSTSVPARNGWERPRIASKDLQEQVRTVRLNARGITDGAIECFGPSGVGSLPIAIGGSDRALDQVAGREADLWVGSGSLGLLCRRARSMERAKGRALQLCAVLPTLIIEVERDCDGHARELARALGWSQRQLRERVAVGTPAQLVPVFERLARQGVSEVLCEPILSTPWALGHPRRLREQIRGFALALQLLAESPRAATVG